MGTEIKTQRVWRGRLPEDVAKDYIARSFYGVTGKGLHVKSARFSQPYDKQVEEATQMAKAQEAILTRDAEDDIINQLEKLAEEHAEEGELIANITPYRTEIGSRTWSCNGAPGEGTCQQGVVTVYAQAVGFVPKYKMQSGEKTE